ncbi:uncharacterized protein TEOVI_000437700 [Trypanosoma equiperdum]|uniref:Arrestin-like N-terminal domain-containing protein n=2 Tax=Trypanozoon TaxID=39700 RepID=Q383N2_TRYB2|nr:hypothetical protein, conserved [Trypanosoma brucei brucei TREU927]EAN79999.1 hypothetical protein, conserved [Trypanosoma brucei brucei TREU927]SCU72793.1 hypothetical protein, conserved [Trypanosoma equiperdum]
MKTHRAAKHVTAHRILLERLSLQPGEVLRGIVEVWVDAPLGYSVLEVVLLGQEFTRLKSSFGKILGKDAAKATYYRQRVVVAGCPGENSQVSVVSEGGGNPEGANSDEWSDFNRSPSVSDVELAGIQSSGLMPGTYTFPFKVRLPSALPPTHEYHIRGSASRLKYTVTSTLLSRGRLLSTTDAPFSVKALPLDESRWMNAYLKTVPMFDGNVLLVSDAASGTEEDRWASLSGLQGTNCICMNHNMPLYAPNECSGSSDSVTDAGGLLTTTPFGAPHPASMDPLRSQLVKPSVNNWLDGASGVNTNEDATEDQKSGHGTEDALQPRASANESEQGMSVFQQADSCSGNKRGTHRGGDDSKGGGQAAAPGASDAQNNVDAAACLNQLVQRVRQDARWEHRLEVPIEGLFGRGSVTITLSFGRVVFTGGTTVRFHGLVDNERGLSNVLMINFSLVTHYQMNSLIETRHTRNVISECSLRQVVKRGEAARIPLCTLEVPQNTSPTAVTSNCSCRTFLDVEVFSMHGPGTRSGSARTELLVVDSLARDEKSSDRKGRWSNYFQCYDPLRGQSRIDIVSSYVLSGKINVIKKDACNGNGELLQPPEKPSRYCKTWKHTFRPQLDFVNATYYPDESSGHNSRGINPLQSLYYTEGSLTE